MKMKGQDTCHRVPLRPIFILNNPSLLAAAPCTSGFAGIPFWYPGSTEMLTGFLQPCTNYLIPDATYISGAAQTPQAAIFPVVPQPIPDGAGVIAVSDFGYAAGSIYTNPDYKSFATTCLTQTLRMDSLYRFDFYAGFGVEGTQSVQLTNALLGPEYSTTPETFGLFGRSDCSAVGNPVPQYSCISRAGWIPLGEVTVKGAPGTWNKTSILFIPPIDINAIAIGPSCDTNFSVQTFVGTYNGQSYDINRYSFFFDSLQFYGAYAPPPIVNLISGDSCTSTVILEMQPASYYESSSFQWYRNDTLLTGGQDSMITIPRSTPGTDTFRCQVLNDTLCLVSNAFLVNWSPLPSAASLGSADTAICQPDSLILNAFADGSFSYVWQDGSTHPWFDVTHDGTYTVTISNSCGSAQAQKIVRFVQCDYDVHVPNAFTPNDDGHNDRFRAHFFLPPAHFSFQIFNRGGLEVYASQDPEEGWDGTFNSTRQPAGGYIWYIRFTDSLGKAHSLNGTLVLIR
jgi:gliding motility-associated-like protein